MWPTTALTKMDSLGVLRFGAVYYTGGVAGTTTFRGCFSGVNCPLTLLKDGGSRGGGFGLVARRPLPRMVRLTCPSANATSTARLSPGFKAGTNGTLNLSDHDKEPRSLMRLRCPAGALWIQSCSPLM